MTGHSDAIAVGDNIAGLKAWAAIFAKRTVFELISWPHRDVFH